MLRIITATFLFTLTFSACAQNVVNLPITKKDPTIVWKGGERDFHSEEWATQVITNTSKPTMEVFLPDNPNGSSIVICPGGALYAHSIASEGNWVAEALNKAGVTAFVLRYRLVPVPSDTDKLIPDSPEVMYKKAGKVLPLAISDAHNAILHIRDNAAKYKIDPARVGVMGFSAGGAVTVGTAYHANEKTNPNFIVPVYFWENVQKIQEVPENAGPAFILCATDDPLQLAPASAELYLSWIRAGKSAELHMFSQGGHGFGLRPSDLPVSGWVDVLTDWMQTEGLFESK